jgi:tRNA-dihydrouridine synthase B
LIKPLKLGNKTFPLNIIQGPLAGISCAPFRLLTRQYSQPAFSCTEMISCKTLIHQPASAQRRFIHKDTQEGPVCFQLASNNSLELAEAVKMVTGYGADLIDLNCGCPVKKIRAKGAGSKLLTDFSTLSQLITAMKKNTSVPVSIKIRVEGKSSDKFHHELIKVINDSGVDFLVVHGRHWTEHYETPCCYEDIQFFTESLSMPVIGNGDIQCVNSLKKMFATGCAGVMISRAGVGQPWLIKKLMAEIQGGKFVLPSLKETGLCFIEHITGLAKLLNNEKFAVLQARKFVKYYARNLVGKTEVREALNHCNTLKNFEHICRSYFI